MTASSPVTSEDIETWRGYIGRCEVRRQVLDIETLRRFAVAVEADLDVEQHMPPLGHWAFFLDVVPTCDLAPDGHSPRGGSLFPPITLPRRMFAGGSVRFLEALALGQPADLTITVADVKHRSGKTGDLVFVEVERVLSQANRSRIQERQTIVFRELGEATPPVFPADQPLRAGAQLWRPQTTDLFRFSAVTFNTHRIHYDLPYARDEEGYPGLIVHGPFTAVKLCGLVQARDSGAPVEQFEFRATAPLFCGQAVQLAPGAGPGEVEAMRCDGAIAMSARASFQGSHG